jgi:hypothetical protein
MSDQNTAPEEEAANAAVESPETGADQQEQIDWRKRAEDHQAAYTQGQQELAQLRQQVQQYADPEHRAQLFQELAQELGYQIQDDDDDDLVDPYARLEERLNQQEQYLAAQQQAQQQEQALDYLDQVVESELGKLPADLPKAAKDWITSRALAMDAATDPHGHPVPDIQGAFREFNDGLVNDLKKSWANTKRAPHVSANGQAGTQTKNVDDMSLEELERWQVQRLADLSAD